MRDRSRQATKRWRENVLLLVASLAITAALGEVAARLILPRPLPWRFPQLSYQPDPNAIFALRPNQRAYSADQPVLINARGLRGPLVPYERTAGWSRVLFLGDSITFGYGVADGEVVTQRVAAIMNEADVAVEVINTAVPAYNTEQEVRYLKQEGLRYHPDWVIVGICWNDIADKSTAQVSEDGWLVLPGREQTSSLARLLESEPAYAARNAIKRSRLVYGALQGWRALRAPGATDQQAQLRADILEGRHSPRVADGWERLAGALRQLRELSENNGFRPLLVAFPIPLALARSYPHSSYPATLKRLADREGLPLIDLTDAFRGAYHGHESLFIPYDGDHPNAAGHALAARAIARFLTAPTEQTRSDS